MATAAAKTPRRDRTVKEVSEKVEQTFFGAIYKKPGRLGEDPNYRFAVNPRTVPGNHPGEEPVMTTGPKPLAKVREEGKRVAEELNLPHVAGLD